MNTFLAGFGLGLSLIVAIGAQNAFILRAGLLRQHVFILCSVCAISDALLIAAGVSGLGILVSKAPFFLAFMKYGGAVFLFVYGFRSLLNSFKGGRFLLAKGEVGSLREAVIICLLLTWLNPHVYLDTVILWVSLLHSIVKIPTLQPAQLLQVSYFFIRLASEPDYCQTFLSTHFHGKY